MSMVISPVAETRLQNLEYLGPTHGNSTSDIQICACIYLFNYLYIYIYQYTYISLHFHILIYSSILEFTVYMYIVYTVRIYHSEAIRCQRANGTEIP